MEDLTQNKFNKFLERLEEESWQLELLVSGFAIFLIIGARPLIEDLLRAIKLFSMSEHTTIVITNLSVIILVAIWSFMLINLIIHVGLRGLWISAIGLRYVSGKIELEELNYQPKFHNYLRRGVMDYDVFIARLEKLCSLVFAFTFLLIFMLISVLLWFVVLQLLGYLVLEILNGKEHVWTLVIFGILAGFLILGGVLYFIDFMTLGLLKKLKYVNKFYYPFYRLLSWITLAYIYRPLYYNLIDNKTGKKLALLLIPYILLWVAFSEIEIVVNKYYPEFKNENFLSKKYYIDELHESEIINTLSVESKYVDEAGFLEVFIPYRGYFNRKFEAICPDIKSEKHTGVRILLMRLFGKNKAIDGNAALACWDQLYQFKIDSGDVLNTKIFYKEHPRHAQKGFAVILDVAEYDRGLHYLNVDLYQDSTSYSNLFNIPFWKK